MLLQEKDIYSIFFIMNEVGIFLDLKNELENEINGNKNFAKLLAISYLLTTLLTSHYIIFLQIT